MPLYDYNCSDRHVTESRQGIDVVSIPCPICGKPATQAEVYREQYMSAETGPKKGSKAVGDAIPLNERDHRQNFSEYVEATGEVDYHYDRAEADGQTVKRPDLYKRAKKRAHAQDSRITV